MSTDHSRSKEGIFPLAEACRQGNDSQVAHSLKQGANPDIADKDGYTSFHHAAATNNTDILNQLLISPLSARDINLQTPLKETPLHLACLEGHLQAAQLLSDRGADLGALDGKRNSVLHFSAASGSTELVEWIVSRDIGRDLLNFQNKDGDTPAHCAGRLGCVDAFTTLSRHNTDLTLKNRWNHTPIDELELHNNRRPESGRASSLSLQDRRENWGNSHGAGGLRENRSNSEPRIDWRRRERESGDGSHSSATDVTGRARGTEIHQASRTQGIGGGKMRRVASPLATTNLSHVPPKQSSTSDTSCNNSSPLTSPSQHAEKPPSDASGTLSSKSASHIDKRRPTEAAARVSGQCAASKSATDIVAGNGSNAPTGTPASEHRPMGREETYNLPQRAEALRGTGRESTSTQSEKLRRRRMERGRAESARGAMTGPSTPELKTRGRAKSDLQPKRKQESFV